VRQIPILFLSDAVDQHTGLARITRDLCSLLSTQPEWRVGSLGLMGHGSRHLPWQQYALGRYPNGEYEYGELTLPAVWDDFAGSAPGILMTIWDLSRMLWLARPDHVQDDDLRRWLEDARARRFKLWSYLPIDAAGPGNALTAMAHDTLLGIERILTYTPWARDVVLRTIGPEAAAARDLTWMPHGLNLDIFTPEGDQVSAGDPDIPLVGCVATNQARKDWGLVACVCHELARRLEGKVRFWWHVDTDLRYWSIPALIADYGLTVDVTHPPMPDRELAARYRACKLTLHPGLGEGFGYPIFESLACGTPALHGDYAGGASILGTLNIACIPSASWRLEGQHNCVRPMFDPDAWVTAALHVLDGGWSDPHSSVSHLHWTKIGPRWRHWFRDGIAEVNDGQ
jgi:glycosyltransferase involved in cell wall biosynthesis